MDKANPPRCWACKKIAAETVTINPMYLGPRPGKPVPLCLDCADTERERRSEKV